MKTPEQMTEAQFRAESFSRLERIEELLKQMVAMQTGRWTAQAGYVEQLDNGYYNLAQQGGWENTSQHQMPFPFKK